MFKPKRPPSALQIATKQGNHALVLLLLCNGYDPNLERECLLDLALETRRPDLVELLLTWGADPHRVDLVKLFDTYDSGLFERFYQLGVDLSAKHALAEGLGYHSSNKPAFGFAKKHQENDQKIRKELNIALAHHAGEGNEKGTLLCLWAGADPHAHVPALRYIQYEDDDEDIEDDEFPTDYSAVRAACIGGHGAVLEKLRPDPSKDDFYKLYRGASSAEVVEILGWSGLPADMTPVILQQLKHAGWWYGGRESVDVLRRLFELGGRWDDAAKEEVGEARKYVLKVSDDRFVDLIELFGTDDYCSSEIRRELARTPSVIKRMKKVGFIPGERNDSGRYWGRRPKQPAVIREKYGIELPAPRKRPRRPRTVSIGREGATSRQLRLNRAGLQKLIWERRFSRLAGEWGMTTSELAKECRGLKIPVPPQSLLNKREAIRRKQ